jgi:GTP cyclohydrolase I
MAGLLDRLLRPQGAGVVIETVRRTGGGAANASVITRKFVGALRDQEEVRREFLTLTNRKLRRQRP